MLKSPKHETNREINTSLMDQDNVSDGKKTKEVRISEVKSMKDLWFWFIKDPMSRWPLLFFLLTFCLILIWMIIFLASGTSGYVMAGLAGMVTGVYGFYHFRLLIALREQVEKFTKLNHNFKQENSAIVQEVNKLQNASIQLRATEDALRLSTEKQKENLHQLTQLNNNLSNVSTNNNEAMSKIQNLSKTMVTKWKDQLLSHEREMLSKVFDQFEFKDNSAGLNEQEFNEFLELLPVRYKARFRKMGDFKKLAGDDGILDFDEFKTILDKMSEQEAVDEKL